MLKGSDVENVEVKDGQVSMDSRRERRQRRRRSGGQTGGLVLIGLGIVFLLLNTGYITWFTNWWALFLLIPAVGLLSGAMVAYRNAGKWTAAVTRPLFGGLLLAALSATFLLEIDLTWVWPLFLIAVGVVLLIGRDAA